MTITSSYLTPESKGEAASSNRLNGRRILIFGAGQDDCGIDSPPIGNGRAMTVLFAREGATIVAVDKNLESVEQTCAMIMHEGGHAAPVQADVCNPDEIEAAVKVAEEVMGGIDGLVYNIGMGAAMGIESLSVDSWDAVMQVNLRGAALVLKAAWPLLSEGASIAITSSVASMIPGSQIPAYDASKAGLAGLMRHAALEGSSRRIRVNIIAPGLIDTAMGRAASKQRATRDSTPIPLGRQGTGWDTAYMALFLLSGEASYITWQVMVIDGGLSTLG